MPKFRLDVRALYDALDAKRDKAGISWRSLASELSLTHSTFTRMSQGRRPDSDSLATMVSWLGVPADRFFIEGEGEENDSED